MIPNVPEAVTVLGKDLGDGLCCTATNPAKGNGSIRDFLCVDRIVNAMLGAIVQMAEHLDNGVTVAGG